MQRLCATLLYISLAMAGASAHAETKIYKKVDAHGNVSFTDVPPRAHEQAEAVDLGRSNSFAPPDTPAPAAEPTSTAPGADAEAREGDQQKYAALKIVSPAHDATVRQNAGNLTVTASVTPALAGNRKMQLLLDGVVASGPSRTTTFQLLNVDRGTHELQAQVVDPAGRALFTSPASVFHMLRYSAIRPAKPAARGNAGATVRR
tara:strand:+ start:44533 stop:45144 length:612 start_codon:yes stop_codon:yes gene_type:complete